MGCKTKYNPKYCKDIIDFFSGEQSRIEYIEYYKGGELQRKEPKMFGNKLPFIAGFAAKIGTTNKTLLDWVEKFPEFKEAYERAKELQKEWLANNALLNLYNSQFAQFTAKNITDWKDKVETEETNNINVSFYLPESKRKLPDKTIEVKAEVIK